MGARLYHWGGNLEPRSPVYIERPEDDRLPEHVLAGHYVTVLGPRQMGKTSLLYRTRERLREAGLAVAYLDLSPTREEPLESFYGHLASELAQQVAEPGVDLPLRPSSHLEFLSSLKAIVENVPSERRVVVMLDEVGMVPEELSDAFFSNIRYIFSNREVRPEFRRTSFVLCGTFQPRDLIRNPANSPFNISKTVRMSDLSRDGVRKLLSFLERMGVAMDDQVPDLVYGWTGGQPYLTQRLCSIFEEWKIPLNGPQVVEAAVREVMMDDVNLDHILHRLEQEPELAPWLERIVLRQEKIRFNRMTNPRLASLELIGAITPARDGCVQVRNRIYRELFEHHLSGDAATGSHEAVSGRSAKDRDGGRECTAVCVDVVDSTRLKQHADKVDVTYTFQQYHQYVTNLVRRRGGHVKDAAGDGVMCIFPTAIDAVECCQEIQSHLPAFNRRHNRLGGEGLRLRIGANTGLVLAADVEDARMTRDLYDYTLDLAGKVQKGAGPGEIAVTEATLRKLEPPVPVIREEYWPEYDLTIYVLVSNGDRA
ncbi:MAG: AAA-like domain-containing protein [Armatimonadetes bacterium]|nr:AAA-like domain-containing protein [Armatimonadota bacterium]